jgi:hypothetical protein
MIRTDVSRFQNLLTQNFHGIFQNVHSFFINMERHVGVLLIDQLQFRTGLDDWDSPWALIHSLVGPTCNVALCDSCKGSIKNNLN